MSSFSSILSLTWQDYCKSQLHQRRIC
jgi:hypothetical protein